MSNKVIKSIGFNIVNDGAMLKHISKKRNFSAYVKKLIAADMLQGEKEKSPEKAITSLSEPKKIPVKVIKKEESPIERLEHFKNILNQPKRQSDSQEQPPQSLT